MKSTGPPDLSKLRKPATNAEVAATNRASIKAGHDQTQFDKDLSLRGPQEDLSPPTAPRRPDGRSRKTGY